MTYLNREDTMAQLKKRSKEDACISTGKTTKQSYLAKAVVRFKSKEFEKHIWDKYLHREDDFMQYDLNCQSQLVAIYMRNKAVDPRNLQEFEFALELLTMSKMRPELKREHFTSVFKLCGYDF